MQSVVISDQKEQGYDLLTMIREKHPAYHPIIAIADIAFDEDASLDLQFNCHKTIAKYILPELKSVEVTTKSVEARRVTVSLFQETQDIQEGELVEQSDDMALVALEAERSVY